MSFILDVAAGVLIAAGIIGLIALGNGIFHSDQRQGGSGNFGWAIGWIGILSGIGLVVARLLRWP